MEEKDLRKIWGAGTGEADGYFNTQRDELLKKAKRRSNDILDRVRRNIIIETIASVVVAIGFPLLFLDDKSFFWLITVLMIGSLILSLKAYRDYLKKIDKVVEDDILSSLDQKVQVLSSYVRRLRRLTYALAPFGFIIGWSFAYFQEPDPNNSILRLLFMIAFTLPFLAIFIWLVKKYIDNVYGKHLKKLIETRDSFKDEIQYDEKQ